MSIDLSGAAAPSSSSAQAPAPGSPAGPGYGGGGGTGIGGGGGYGGGGGGGGYGGGLGAQAAAAAFGDPHVQQQLKEQASQGFTVAREGAAVAVAELRKYVQEGPAGISILCFTGGIVTTIIGALGLLNIASILTLPFQYVLNAYLTLFGIITFLLEADMEALRGMRVLGRLTPFVERYQVEVFNRAKVLTELRGRGFFYVFVGSLAITQCFFCLLFLVGVWNLLMGMLCLLMSFGINPAEHMRVQRAGDQGLPLHDQQHGGGGM